METSSTNIDGAIVIDGHPYGVGRAQGSTVNVRFGVNEWKPKKRNKNESDEAMQARVQADVDKWRAIQQGATDAAALAGSPASVRKSSLSLKPSPTGAQGRMTDMPPPPSKRPNRTSTASGGAAAASSSSRAEPADSAGAGSGSSSDHALKRMQKKERETLRLIEQRDEGHTLSPEEAAKVAQLPNLVTQIALLQTTPVVTPMVTPIGTPCRTPSSEASAARTMPAAACAAATCNTAQAALQSLPPTPPRRVWTRANAVAVEREMAQERAELQLKRQAAGEAAAAAEQDMWLMLRAPFDSWDSSVIWQLAMCEFAFEHLDDVAALSSKQLQLEFRAACEEVRHPAEVPRLRGSLQIDALQEALVNSTPLYEELQYQLSRYKRLYCSMFSGFGRFREVTPIPGESLLALMKRTHDASLKWRPPGRPPAEQLALVSKEGGRYKAEWREDTWMQRHEDTGKTLSLRGTSGVTKAGLRRLKNMSDEQRPAHEHYTTIRLHDYQAHHIQRSKSLTNSFAVQRCTLQWDEVTMNSLAWCVIILNCMRTPSIREREVILKHTYFEPPPLINLLSNNE